MEHYIENMQDTVMKYADILSEVLKVDVEIVDSSLKRIAGAGRFKGLINNNISSEGHIYKWVIKHGERNVNKYPGEQDICQGCPNVNNCEEKFGMTTPIILNGKVIGVIGLVCFTEEQHHHVKENLEIFFKLSDQIADLIVLKAKEEIEINNMKSMMDLLINTIDQMNEGVVIYDENQNIYKYNELAGKMLDFHTDDICEVIELEKTENYILDKREYKMKLAGRSLHFVGDLYEIPRNDEGIYNVFIFNDVNTMRTRLLAATASHEAIGMERLLGAHPSIHEIKKTICRVSRTSSTILITGESGTGKELFSRAFHYESTRSDKPFVAINCASVPDSLLESELFGYVKGAFTGADPKGKVGKFELAHGGTLFLDEIGDMPLFLQAKLLRVLQERKIVRLGSNEEVEIDVRVIAATNKNIEQMILDKTFREDLYYRLNVIPISVPPLRERSEDIILLARHFIRNYLDRFDKKVEYIDPEVFEILSSYQWPGNVRELENVVEYMVNMMESGVIDKALLPDKILCESESGISSYNLEEIERKTITDAIEFCGQDLKGKKKAANLMGISLATLYRKLERYKLQ